MIMLIMITQYKICGVFFTLLLKCLVTMDVFARIYLRKAAIAGESALITLIASFAG